MRNHQALRFLCMALAGPVLFAGGWWAHTPQIPHDLLPPPLRDALVAVRPTALIPPPGYALGYSYALPDGSLVVVFVPED